MSGAEITTLLAAIIGGIVGLVSATVAARAAKSARRANRADRLDRDNHLLYLWNRQLIDHIYTRKEPPPPMPPAGLFTP